MYRIHQIKLKPHQDTDMIPDLIRKKLGKRELVLKNITIARESIDARDKSNIRKVYTVDFDSNIKLDLPQVPDILYWSHICHLLTIVDWLEKMSVLQRAC